MNFKTKDSVHALFVTAGFTIMPSDVIEIVNQYWIGAVERFVEPRDERDKRWAQEAFDQYAPMVLNNPWWLVRTEYGNIVFGPRKRVYHLEWVHTKFRGTITVDNVTSEHSYVHAWTDQKLVEYLMKLNQQLENLKLIETHSLSMAIV